MAKSSINIAGLISLATARKTTEIAMSQVIPDVGVKPGEMTVPTGGAYHPVPLNLSPTMTEALVLVLYSPKKLNIQVTSSDSGTPGPIRLGLKGLWVLTLTPEHGITAVSASNSGTDDVVLEYAIVAQETASDELAWWDD